MTLKPGKKAEALARAAAAAAVILVAAFAIVGPLACGKVKDKLPTTPTNPTDPARIDAIPINEIIWDGQRNPSTWKVRTDLAFAITGIRPSKPAPTICWSWNLPSNWPNRNGKSVGNNWIIVKIDGAWHATPWEHVKATNTSCRTTEALNGQPPFIQGYGPIAAKWYPAVGEDVGFMNSTIARGDRDPGTPDERTPIVMTKWPAN
ncbi:MAG TPA: hypothetical protein VN317_06810 [Candidatus Methanoperedens sp.]|nr:hypothetical protein [Candidatus Methanoperedens sp.]